MTITALPTPPSRLDAVNFSERADAFLGALPQFVNEANSLEALIQYNALVGSCTNTLSIATGTKTISTQTNKAWVAGMYVYLIYPTDYTQTMTGTVSSYNASSGALIVNVTQVTGSGSYSNWNIVTVNPPQSAANVSGGSAGQILRQSAPNTTAFVGPESLTASAAAGGTADALTATFSPSITSLAAGTLVYVRAALANATSTPTFKANATAAKVIVKGNGVALNPGDIAGAGHWLELVYDATLDRWVLSNPATAVSPNRASANRIINGSMAVDQRNNGASVAVNSTLRYAADRFIVVLSTGTATAQRTGSAGAYALTVTASTAVTGLAVAQRIESHNISDLAGQTVTVSFTASSNAITSLPWAAFFPTAQDNYSSTTVISSGSLAITSTPTRYTFQLALPAGAVNGLGINFASNFSMASGNTLTITDVQVEEGSVATKFEREDIGTTLAKCQRYFYQPTAAGSLSQRAQQYGSVAGSNLYKSIYFPVPMRATPTVVAMWINGTNADAGTISADGTASASAKLIAYAPGEFAATINWTSFSAEI